MQTVVLVLMILITFNFLLKQTFHNWYNILIMALIAALFVGFMWPTAAEQSKLQIAAWLENPTLMLDTSVLLSIDVALQMTFCILAVQSLTDNFSKKINRLFYSILFYFPGIMIFVILFSLLVSTIYMFPGASFAIVAWSLAGVIFLFLPLLTFAIRKLLPEEDIRIELLFLTNAVTAIMGIIATVNGRTAVEGFSELNIQALAMIIALLLVGTITGLIIRKHKSNKTN